MDEFTRERYPGTSAADLERERRARPPLRRHVFAPSGRRTHGVRICATCDGLEHHSIHRVPEVSEEAKEVDQRRVGERP